MQSQASEGLQRLIKTLFARKRRAHMVLLVVALGLGVLSAHAAVGFYQGIEALLFIFFNETEKQLASGVRALPWWHIILIPTAVGAIVGQIIRHIPEERAGGVGEVIEAMALKGGHLSLKSGILSGSATLLALGGGSSTGREGPVVHLAASLAGGLTKRFGLPAHAVRTLVGCSVAAAVAASFNAPFAGVFFALEVIIGHYALHAFAPIVIAAIAGTVTSRAYLGDYPAFVMGDYAIASVWEFPAFVCLGLIAAVVAVSLARALSGLETKRETALKNLPIWALPPIGGALIGTLGIWIPEILSVGYEATSTAITGGYGAGLLITLLIAKFIAVALSFLFRLGSGVFSPALFLGAMLGGAFGLGVTALAPGAVSTPGLYAVVGMGAVASAVLGAPISTFLIIFEITGEYGITLAVMVACAVASQTAYLFGHTSVFHTLLTRRGIALEGGKATYLLKSASASEHMETDFFTVHENTPAQTLVPMLLDMDGLPVVVTDHEGLMQGTVRLVDIPPEVIVGGSNETVTAMEIARTYTPTLRSTDPLKKAMELFEETNESVLPVTSVTQTGVVVGLLRHRSIMTVYTRALLETQGRDAQDD